MLFLDAKGVAFARALPPWLVDTFNEITDYGKSGWFLVPLAGLIMAAAILRAAPRARSPIWCSPASWCASTYLFLAIAVPGLVVTVVKRLIGRVRPSESGPFAYIPWSWQHEYASLPSGHTTTAFAAAVGDCGAVAEGAHADAGLRRDHRGEPGRHHGAFRQ